MASTATFDFGMSCLLPQAEVLRYALIGKLGKLRSKSLVLDLSKVETADISLVQILLSLKKSAAAKGVALEMRSSPTVDSLLSRAGVAPFGATGGGKE
ncbi:STAS domain-containing protein [Antarcticirhabdus aurantiaca]|uniref:STAS domain-containing protein n=1 Tax=Antarcticirhabdus aurantiaca TaxID=2606717 RepID=A0ACD4NSU6_9HYPH|nr:STAS domain-containing protein [Antarcticirhabdus aurantiaca]WAJ29838.1 STAS domain-containing protein [Jeongeuplla avenae]